MDHLLKQECPFSEKHVGEKIATLFIQNFKTMSEQTKQPIFIFAKWQVKASGINKVLELLPELVKKSTNEEGNLSYKIFRNGTDTNTLILMESYRDEASIALHKNSDHYQQIVVQHIVPLLENREVTLVSELHLNGN